MGKVKRARNKYHASAVKGAAEEVKSNDGPVIIDSGKVEAIFPGEGLFQGLDIPAASLKQNLQDWDVRSTITSKSLRGTNMKKKDKRKLRHDMWIKKIDTITHTMKEEKDRKKRQKTAVVGDMQPLGETLPTLELLLRDHKPQPAPTDSDTKSKKSTKKETRRRKEMLEDIGLFHQVLEHPAFKSNPTGTVSEHLHNKMELESTDS